MSSIVFNSCVLSSNAMIVGSVGYQPARHHVSKVVGHSAKEYRNQVRSGGTLKVRSDAGVLASPNSTESVQLIPNLKQFIAYLIASVPEVHKVLIRQDGRMLDVCAVVPEYDLDVNERIYDKEELIMDVFTNFDFDFHITSQRDIADPDFELVLSR